MNSEHRDDGVPAKGRVDTPGKGSEKGSSPEWATGLRKLYKSVVDEPLPDSFKDLLSELDKRD